MQKQPDKPCVAIVARRDCTWASASEHFLVAPPEYCTQKASGLPAGRAQVMGTGVIGQRWCFKYIFCGERDHLRSRCFRRRSLYID